MKRLYCIPLCLIMLIILPACGQKIDQPTWQEQYDMGVRCLSEGNYEEAIIAFEAAIKIDPKHSTTYRNLANSYKAVGDLDNADRVLSEGFRATGDSTLLIDVFLEITSDRTGTLTMQGIQIQDKYSFDSEKMDDFAKLLQWWVTLKGSSTEIAVWSGAWNRKGDTEITWDNMQHSISWYDKNGVDHTIFNSIPTVTTFENGIQWSFSIPASSEDGTALPFDLREINQAEFFVYDIAQGGLVAEGITTIPN